MSGFTTFDLVCTIGYLVGIVSFGCWLGLRKKKHSDASEYFLAGQTLRWPVIGMALFATNISCVHLISLAQSGFDTGLLNGNFEWMAAFTLVLLGLFFAPFYIRSKVTTLPDFLEQRYCRSCRDMLAILSIVSAITIHIGFSFLTGGKVLGALFGFDMYKSIIVIAVLTGLYTIIGGLIAVVMTETIQTVVLIAGAAMITWFAWDKVGGWGEMMTVLQQKNALGADNLDKVSMLRPHGDSSGMPWYAILLGYPVLGIWYWCADQTIVQRVLGAKDENHARVGPLFAGLIKILPVFIFVLPGLLALTLVKSGKLDLSKLDAVPNKRDISALIQTDLGKQLNTTKLVEVGALDKQTLWLDLDKAPQAGVSPATLALIKEKGGRVADSKGLYTAMVVQLLPPGLTGIMVAALLAALMSTVAGALNSISTLFSYDLYKRFYPQATDRKLVAMGRISAGVALIVAIGLVPGLDKYPSVFNGLNDIIAHIAPPVTCVFTLGVFWKRASAQSAKLTMILGSLLGIGVYLFNKLGPETFLAHIPFMMMAVYLLAANVLMQVVFTYAFPKQQTEDVQKLYWESPLDPVRTKGWPGIGDYRFLAGLLIAVMCVLYYVFR